MKRSFIILLGLILFSSCLKKLEEVEQATDNIFDPKFEGEQWFELDTLYLYTNFLNFQFVKFEFHIKDEYTPRLKPTVIDLAGSVNGGNTKWFQIGINYNGTYDGSLSVSPDGSSNYCIDLGVGVINNGDSLVINRFTECRDL